MPRAFMLGLVMFVSTPAHVGCVSPRSAVDGGLLDGQAGADGMASDDADAATAPCTLLTPGPPATGTSVDGPPPPLSGGAITAGVYDLTSVTMYSSAGDGGTTPATGTAAQGALALGADASFALRLGAPSEPMPITFAGTFEQRVAGLALALTCPSWASNGTIPYEATPTTIALEYSTTGAGTTVFAFSLRP